MVKEFDILQDFVTKNGNRNLLIGDREEMISEEGKVRIKRSITFTATPDTEGGVNDLNIVAMGFTGILFIGENLVGSTLFRFEHNFKQPLRGELSIRRD